MTTPTPPRDLSEHDRAGIAGRIITPDPAAVERFMALMAEQRAAQPTRQAEATRRQYSGDRIAANIQRAAQARADKTRFVLSDEQMADVEQRRAAGETWEMLSHTYHVSHTTIQAAYLRQQAAAKKAARQVTQ
jgi:hypothetical protein